MAKIISFFYKMLYFLKAAAYGSLLIFLIFEYFFSDIESIVEIITPRIVILGIVIVAMECISSLREFVDIEYRG